MLKPNLFGLYYPYRWKLALQISSEPVLYIMKKLGRRGVFLLHSLYFSVLKAFFIYSLGFSFMSELRMLVWCV